ncbi:phosphate ABC transporter permease [Halobiforma lacisalsi AJ5]|uniref:Phosphate transport system permease protein n=1 Tax=Natronobacterium lacisalsi AJ5 TaxID=358396 RepID=M0LER8_NATLA|nr:phosphate ABC transporter permease subunit PstC [Halobiforma lacisalsi]EMA31593.1 phosphate ABC transporter permease [Halobiforma lacisalsi AJ5]
MRRERLYEYVLFGCMTLTVLITVGIIYSLFSDAIYFVDQYAGVLETSWTNAIRDFLFGTNWRPTIQPYRYGLLPLLSGTIVVTVASAAVALPCGLGAAIYISEYATERTRAYLKPALEILAGVPTVVYGYFALVYITPWLQKILPLSTFNAMSASIMVGIMIIPMVSSISEDALSSVPDELRQAGYGLGATKFDVSTRVVVPAALSGIFSSFILAISRAIGETMIVTMAAGQNPQMLILEPTSIHENLYDSIQTITAAMVQAAGSDVVGGTPVYWSMFALGLALFAFTFTMNLVAEYVKRRYREVY